MLMLAGCGGSSHKTTTAATSAPATTASTTPAASVPTSDVASRGAHQQRAFGRLAARASPAVNVAFTSGDYYYLVGAFVSALTANSEAAIIAAASRLYHRVHG